MKYKYKIGDIVKVKSKEQLLNEGWCTHLSGLIGPEIYLVVLPSQVPLLGMVGMVGEIFVTSDRIRYRIQSNMTNTLWPEKLLYLPLEEVLNNIRIEIGLNNEVENKNEYNLNGRKYSNPLNPANLYEPLFEGIPISISSRKFY
jgi:hypothetical protein